MAELWRLLPDCVLVPFARVTGLWRFEGRSGWPLPAGWPVATVTYPAGDETVEITLGDAIYRQRRFGGKINILRDFRTMKTKRGAQP